MTAMPDRRRERALFDRVAEAIGAMQEIETGGAPGWRFSLSVDAHELGILLRAGRALAEADTLRTAARGFSHQVGPGLAIDLTNGKTP